MQRRRGWHAIASRPAPARYLGAIGCLVSILAEDPAAAEASLSTMWTFTVGDRPVSVAVADFNGDGLLDLVTANVHSHDVSVLLGNGDGSFLAAASSYSDSISSLAVGDLDGDGVLDLATATYRELFFGVSVLLGNGDGSFQAPVLFPVGGPPISVAVADVDGDTVPDVVAAGTPMVVGVLLGKGDGTLRAARSAFPGGAPVFVTVADLNGDGLPDLVTANSWDDNVSVMLAQPATGRPRRFLSTLSPVGDGPRSVAVADLDGDGVPDLVTANGQSDDVSVLLGNGDGTFRSAMAFGVGFGPVSVAVADLNGDAVPDLATANSFSEDVSVLLGSGDGSFQAANPLPVGSSPSSVAVADLDGDGVLDLVTASPESNIVTVLLNPLRLPARIEIAIKPGSDSMMVNPMARGVIPVAILGSDTFDVSEVDGATLAFGSSAAPLAHRNGPHAKDVNRDRIGDLVAHFRTEESGIVFGDTEACATGELLDGTPFEGCGSIRTVPACGIGFELALVLPGLMWLRPRRRAWAPWRLGKARSGRDSRGAGLHGGVGARPPAGS